MKRKTIILLSSVLAGSLLVGGAFAAYAVTDNADPIGVDVKTQAPDQDTPVTLTWGAKEHANIPDLDSGKYAKAGYFTVKSDIAYEGIFSVKMEDKTPQAIIDAKGTESPVFLFDNLEVFVYSGNVVLTDGELPAELPAGVELVGSISTNQAAVDGVKKWSKTVASDLDGKVFSVLVKSEATDAVLGQLSQDVVRLTIDWGMGADSHEAQTEGYFLKLGDANPTALTENTDTDKTDGRIAEYTTTKEVVAGQAIKIVKDGVAADSEHVTFEENGNATSAGNIVASGESTFWIKVYNGQDQYVGQLFYVVYVTNPSSGDDPQPTETVYRVVGDFNEWTYNNGVALELVSGDHYQATGVVLEADGAVKVTDGDKAWYGVDHWYQGCGYEQQDNYPEGNAPLKAGTYTVNLYTNSQDGNFLSFVKTA